MTTNDKGNPTELAFNDTYYAPNTLLNIISVGKLKNHIKFDTKKEAIIYKALGHIVVIAK